MKFPFGKECQALYTLSDEQYSEVNPSLQVGPPPDGTDYHNSSLGVCWLLYLLGLGKKQDKHNGFMGSEGRYGKQVKGALEKL